ncbi:MAG: hypothetical protein IJE08_02160 [Clostridia bacterium]|nr:hypothetical protein [Clostridia bacterium]
MSKLIWIGVIISMLAGLFGLKVYSSQSPPTQANSRVDSFSYSHSGSSTYEIYSYEVKKDEETGERTVYYDLYCELITHSLPADEELMQQLSAVIDEYSLRKWDGFNRINSMVTDGSGFSLKVLLEDGTGISARGSNSFPDGFGEAAEAIDNLFLGYLKRNGIDPEGGF